MYEQLQANGSNIFNDPKATLAERDAEIKRLTEENQDLRNDRFNATELLKTSESEIARLRAEVEKIEKAQKVWVLCNRGEKQPKVWSGTGAIQVFDSWAVAETVASSGKAFITNPFALVPVEDKP